MKKSSGDHSKSHEKSKGKASSVHPVSQQALHTINQRPSSGSIKSQESSSEIDHAAELSRLKKNRNHEADNSYDIMEIV